MTIYSTEELRQKGFKRMMFKDFSDHKTIKKSFAWIKKNLDPKRSYIVFENDLNKQADSILSEFFIAYQYLEKENYAWKKIYDSQCSKEYLVIQIDPGNEDETLGKIIGYGFGKDIISYLYKSEIR